MKRYMRRNRKNGKEERKATKTENRKGGWVLIFNMQSFRRDSCLNFSLPYMPISRATRSSLSPNSVLCSYLHVLSMSSRDMTIPSMAAPSVPRGHAPHEPGCHKGFTPTHPPTQLTKSNYLILIWWLGRILSHMVWKSGGCFHNWLKFAGDE